MTRAVSRKAKQYSELTKILRDPIIQQDINTALNTPFEVIVLATMSAGKSTLINALLGRELLPSSNEACTSRVFRVEDDDMMDSFAARLEGEEYFSNWQAASVELLQDMNLSKSAGVIELRGDVPKIDNEGGKLVIYDTPGPNNSRDNSHNDITFNTLRDGNHGLILYVLNASQIGVDDDATFLRELLKVVELRENHKDIIFILNKADVLDEEQGESLTKAVELVKSYLVNIGFKSPAIIPISAVSALLARKTQRNEKLSRRERHILESFNQLASIDKNHMLDAALLPKNKKSQLLLSISLKPISDLSPSDHNESIYDAKQLSDIEHYSGIFLVEELIQQKMITDGTPTAMANLVESLNKHGLVAFSGLFDSKSASEKMNDKQA